MDSKYCSQCGRKFLLSGFLKDASALPGSKVFSTCIICREKAKRKRAASVLSNQPVPQRPRITVVPVVSFLLSYLGFTDIY
jgi:hypothetical protein